jgi:AraC-like DNA-binding protein
MQATSTALLERHRIFHSRNPEETRSFLASKEFRLDYPDCDAAVDTHINGIYLPGSYIGCFYYGRATQVRATPARTDFWVQITTRGRFELTQAREQVVCDGTTAAVLSPTHENLVCSDRNCSRLVMSLSGATVIRQLVALLGGPVHASLEFAAPLDVRSGYGLSIARFMRTAAADLECADGWLHNPIAMSLFEQFIVGALLLSHRHNYSEALSLPQKSISPRDVKRAIDYIRANLDTAVTLADIVAAAGVPGRTLFKHFRAFTGMSPMNYLRATRMERIRAALLDAEHEESIAGIAARYGFDHPGRFALEYRKRFGEKPSQTCAECILVKRR